MRLVLIFVVTLVINFNYTSTATLPGVCKKRVLKRVERIIDGLKVQQFVPRLVKTCCEGYTPVHRRCVPICDNMCINSVCTAPNTCSCNRGYKKLNSYRCGPRCDNCKYGFCISPGACTCYKGYRKNPTTNRCEPSCSKPCVNGICSDPDFCKCNNGYRISSDDLFTCVQNKTITSTTSGATTTTEFFTSTEFITTTEADETTFNEDHKWYPYTKTEDVGESTAYFNHKQSMISPFQLLNVNTIRPLFLPIKILGPSSAIERHTTDYFIPSESSAVTLSTFVWSTLAPSEGFEWTSEARIDRPTPDDIPIETIENSSVEKVLTSTIVDPTSTEIDSTSTEVDSTSTEVDSASTKVDSTSTTVDLTSTIVDSTPTEEDATSLIVDPTSTEVDLTSTEGDSTSTTVDATSTEVDPIIPILLEDSTSTEVDSASTIVDTTSIELDSVSTIVVSTSTEISPNPADLLQKSTTLIPGEVKTFDQKDTDLLSTTETVVNTHNTRNLSDNKELIVLEPSDKIKDITVRKGSVTLTFNIRLLYCVLATVAIFGAIALTWFMCTRPKATEYNMAKLEKKKGVVKYSVEKNDLITAW